MLGIPVIREAGVATARWRRRSPEGSRESEGEFRSNGLEETLEAHAPGCLQENDRVG